MTSNDMDLVREFAARQSEPAFVELVSRHVSLIYSTALRQAGNPSLAEEITQAVFIILARKAGSLGANTILSSWLYRTTCYAAKDALRTQRRRQHREQEAYMQSMLQEAQTDTAWEQLAPFLDEAMTRLRQDDRDALVLRFFENKSLQEIGAAIGTSEDAAKKRVGRALEKLRRYFSKRGVAVPAAVLTTVICANSIQAAPITLANTAAAIALSKSAAAAGSTLAIVKGAMNFMAWAKAKTAVTIAAGVLLAAGATGVVTTLDVTPSSPDAIHEKLWASLQARNPDTARISALLNSAPPALVIRPTHYSNSAPGFAWEKETAKGCAINVNVIQLIWIAYGHPRLTTISPSMPAADNYDLIMIGPDRNQNVTALRQEIQTRFGLIANTGIAEMNILRLTLKNPGGPQPSKNKGSSFNAHFPDRERELQVFSLRNASLDAIAYSLGALLDIPVVDYSGVTNHFDFEIQIDPRQSRERIRQSVRGQAIQFGLELKPGYEPIETLLVERMQ